MVFTLLTGDNIEINATDINNISAFATDTYMSVMLKDGTAYSVLGDFGEISEAWHEALEEANKPTWVPTVGDLIESKKTHCKCVITDIKRSPCIFEPYINTKIYTLTDERFDTRTMCEPAKIVDEFDLIKHVEITKYNVGAYVEDYDKELAIITHVDEFGNRIMLYEDGTTGDFGLVELVDRFRPIDFRPAHFTLLMNHFKELRKYIDNSRPNRK